MIVIRLKPSPVTRTVERLAARYRLYMATVAAGHYSTLAAQVRAGRAWARKRGKLSAYAAYYDDQAREAAEGLLEAHKRQAVAKSQLSRFAQ